MAEKPRIKKAQGSLWWYCGSPSFRYGGGRTPAIAYERWLVRSNDGVFPPIPPDLVSIPWHRLYHPTGSR